MSGLFRHPCPALLVVVLAIGPVRLAAQDPPPPEADKPAVPQISEEPKGIDPATLLPEKLAASATADFQDTSLREVAEWIQTQQEIPVLLDTAALSREGILPTTPVSDHLRNEPVYLLLNRLQSLGLDWFYKDEIVHITTAAVARDRMITRSYNVGDLIDAGYGINDLVATVQTHSGTPWEVTDGEGGAIQWLGDVLLVRQNHDGHQVVAGLLAALRKHGRQTFVWDPPQHIALREKLDRPISVELVDVPLATAVSALAEQSGADIRLATSELSSQRISGREPVSLVLSNRNLQTVLRLLLAKLNLDWTLHDGVLWVTTAKSAAESHFKTAVYDVRDLCRNDEESMRLAQAIYSQTGAKWIELDGAGGTLTFAKPGTMVVRHNEQAQQQVAAMLAMYRDALTSSKPRPRDDSFSKEILTVYYRVPTLMAEGLAEWLPATIDRESWRSDERPDAPGELLAVLASPPEMQSAPGLMQFGDGGEFGGGGIGGKPGGLAGQTTDTLLVPQTVLVIRHTRAAHEEIGKVISRIEHGDPHVAGEEMLGGFGSGGLGGGGFGGAGGGLGGGTGSGGAGFGGGFFSHPAGGRDR